VTKVAANDIATQAEHLRTEAALLFSSLMTIEAPGGEKLDLQLQIPGTPNSAAQINARILGLCSLADGLNAQPAKKIFTGPKQSSDWLSARTRDSRSFCTRAKSKHWGFSNFRGRVRGD